MGCAVQLVPDENPETNRLWLIRFHDQAPLGQIAFREGRPFGPYDAKAVGIYPADTHGWVFWCTQEGNREGFQHNPPAKVTPWSKDDRFHPMATRATAEDAVRQQAKNLRCAWNKTPAEATYRRRDDANSPSKGSPAAVEKPAP